MSGIKAIPLAIQKKPISLQISAARKTLYTHTRSRLTPFEKNISSCLTNKPTRVNRCTHPLCVFALTPAIANLHERLESSKQWGKRSAAYYSSLLIPLTCVPPLSARNAFHLLSGRTIPLALCWALSFFSAAGKLKWWDAPMCHVSPSTFHTWLTNDYTGLHLRKRPFTASCNFFLFLFFTCLGNTHGCKNEC